MNRWKCSTARRGLTIIIIRPSINKCTHFAILLQYYTQISSRQNLWFTDIITNKRCQDITSLVEVTNLIELCNYYIVNQLIKTSWLELVFVYLFAWTIKLENLKPYIALCLLFTHDRVIYMIWGWNIDEENIISEFVKWRPLLYSTKILSPKKAEEIAMNV